MLPFGDISLLQKANKGSVIHFISNFIKNMSVMFSPPYQKIQKEKHSIHS